MGPFRRLARIREQSMILAAVMDPDAPLTTVDEIAKLRRSDPDALQDAILRYQHRLYRYLLRLVEDSAAAEDLFQQTWVRVMENIRRYDAQRSFEAWLFTLAHNLAIDYLRRRRPDSLNELTPSGEVRLGELVGNNPDALEQALEWERAAIVAAAMRELPAIHREVLTLRFEEDLKLEQISEIAQVPLSTVKSRLHRALDGLRTRLENRFGQGGAA
jgi:RNA polymerase sigma-70 factor (ECF subfamily)